MEEHGRDARANSSKDQKKHGKDSSAGISKNITRNLMYRDYGIGDTNKASTRSFESVAEANLIVKRHTELKCDLPGVPRATFLMVFSPDGTKVASTHGNHFIYVTDLTTGKNISTLSGHPRTPWCIAFHPWSNNILASGCLGGQVRVWDLSGGSEVWNAESRTVIASLAFHPSERLLVIATYNEIHFWDWNDSRPFAVATTRNEKEKVRYVAFDKSGKKLITGIGNIPKHSQSQWDRGPRDPMLLRAPLHHLWRPGNVAMENYQSRFNTYRARAIIRHRAYRQMNMNMPGESSFDGRRNVNYGRRETVDTTEDDNSNDHGDSRFRTSTDARLNLLRELITDTRTYSNEELHRRSRLFGHLVATGAMGTFQSPSPRTGNVTIEVPTNAHAPLHATEPEIHGVNGENRSRMPTSSPMEIDQEPEFTMPRSSNQPINPINTNGFNTSRETGSAMTSGPSTSGNNNGRNSNRNNDHQNTSHTGQSMKRRNQDTIDAIFAGSSSDEAQSVLAPGASNPSIAPKRSMGTSGFTVSSRSAFQPSQPRGDCQGRYIPPCLSNRRPESADTADTRSSGTSSNRRTENDNPPGASTSSTENHEAENDEARSKILSDRMRQLITPSSISDFSSYDQHLRRNSPLIISVLEEKLEILNRRIQRKSDEKSKASSNNVEEASGSCSLADDPSVAGTSRAATEKNSTKVEIMKTANDDSESLSLSSSRRTENDDPPGASTSSTENDEAENDKARSKILQDRLEQVTEWPLSGVSSLDQHNRRNLTLIHSVVEERLEILRRCMKRKSDEKSKASSNNMEEASGSCSLADDPSVADTSRSATENNSANVEKFKTANDDSDSLSSSRRTKNDYPPGTSTSSTENHEAEHMARCEILLDRLLQVTKRAMSSLDQDHWSNSSLKTSAIVDRSDILCRLEKLKSDEKSKVSSNNVEEGSDSCSLADDPSVVGTSRAGTEKNSKKLEKMKTSNDNGERSSTGTTRKDDCLSQEDSKNGDKNAKVTSKYPSSLQKNLTRPIRRILRKLRNLSATDFPPVYIWEDLCIAYTALNEKLETLKSQANRNVRLEASVNENRGSESLSGNSEVAGTSSEATENDDHSTIGASSSTDSTTQSAAKNRDEQDTVNDVDDVPWTNLSMLMQHFARPSTDERTTINNLEFLLRGTFMLKVAREKLAMLKRREKGIIKESMKISSTDYTDLVRYLENTKKPMLDIFGNEDSTPHQLSWKQIQIAVKTVVEMDSLYKREERKDDETLNASNQRLNVIPENIEIRLKLKVLQHLITHGESLKENNTHLGRRKCRWPLLLSVMKKLSELDNGDNGNDGDALTTMATTSSSSSATLIPERNIGEDVANPETMTNDNATKTSMSRDENEDDADSEKEEMALESSQKVSESHEKVPDASSTLTNDENESRFRILDGLEENGEKSSRALSSSLSRLNEPGTSGLSVMNGVPSVSAVPGSKELWREIKLPNSDSDTSDNEEDSDDENVNKVICVTVGDIWLVSLEHMLNCILYGDEWKPEDDTDSDSTNGSDDENRDDTANNNENRNNVKVENGEQSGYWLLEENNHSDSNVDNESEEYASGTNGSRRWTSRWIPVRTADPHPNGQEPSSAGGEENFPGVIKREGEIRESTDDDVALKRERLSPVVADSERYVMRYPCALFTMIREKRAREEEERRRKSDEAASGVSRATGTSREISRSERSRRVLNAGSRHETSGNEDTPRASTSSEGMSVVYSNDVVAKKYEGRGKMETTLDETSRFVETTKHQRRPDEPENPTSIANSTTTTTANHTATADPGTPETTTSTSNDSISWISSSRRRFAEEFLTRIADTTIMSTVTTTTTTTTTTTMTTIPPTIPMTTTTPDLASCDATTMSTDSYQGLLFARRRFARDHGMILPTTTTMTTMTTTTTTSTTPAPIMTTTTNLASRDATTISADSYQGLLFALKRFAREHGMTMTSRTMTTTTTTTTTPPTITTPTTLDLASRDTATTSTNSYPDLSFTLTQFIREYDTMLANTTMTMTNMTTMTSTMPTYPGTRDTLTFTYPGTRGTTVTINPRETTTSTSNDPVSWISARRNFAQNFLTRIHDTMTTTTTVTTATSTATTSADPGSRGTTTTNSESNESTTGFRGWTSRRQVLQPMNRRSRKARSELHQLYQIQQMWINVRNQIKSLSLVVNNDGKYDRPGTSSDTIDDVNENVEDTTTTTTTTTTTVTATTTSATMTTSATTPSHNNSEDLDESRENLLLDTKQLRSEYEKLTKLRMTYVQEQGNEDESRPSTSATADDVTVNDDNSTRNEGSSFVLPPSISPQCLLAILARLKVHREFLNELEDRAKPLVRKINERDVLKTPDRSDSSESHGDDPSTSGENNQNDPESAINYKKALLANYKRENNETDLSPISCDDNEPGTSAQSDDPDTVPAKQPRLMDDPSTNPNSSTSTSNDHTYSNLTTHDDFLQRARSMKLPNVFYLHEQIFANNRDDAATSSTSSDLQTMNLLPQASVDNPSNSNHSSSTRQDCSANSPQDTSWQRNYGDSNARISAASDTSRKSGGTKRRIDHAESRATTSQNTARISNIASEYYSERIRKATLLLRDMIKQNEKSVTPSENMDVNNLGFLARIEHGRIRARIKLKAIVQYITNVFERKQLARCMVNFQFDRLILLSNLALQLIDLLIKHWQSTDIAMQSFRFEMSMRNRLNSASRNIVYSDYENVRREDPMHPTHIYFPTLGTMIVTNNDRTNQRDSSTSVTENSARTVESRNNNQNNRETPNRNNYSPHGQFTGSGSIPRPIELSPIRLDRIASFNVPEVQINNVPIIRHLHIPRPTLLPSQPSSPHPPSPPSPPPPHPPPFMFPPRSPFGHNQTIGNERHDTRDVRPPARSSTRNIDPIESARQAIERDPRNLFESNHWLPMILRGVLQRHPSENPLSRLSMSTIGRLFDVDGGGQDPGNDSDDVELRERVSASMVYCGMDIQSYRVQAWDFTHAEIPDVTNPEENVIVKECKIHNDASIDISSDGKLLTTLLPPQYLNDMTTLGVYSLEWESLGERVHWARVDQTVVSLSLSPTGQNLLVGLASRRVYAVTPERPLPMALIYELSRPTSEEKNNSTAMKEDVIYHTTEAYRRVGRLTMPNDPNIQVIRQFVNADPRPRDDEEDEDEEEEEEEEEEEQEQEEEEEDEEEDENVRRDYFNVPPRNYEFLGDRMWGSPKRTKLFKGNMILRRELIQSNHETARYVSLNCIRWAPQPGQGMVYATSTGQLNILH